MYNQCRACEYYRINDAIPDEIMEWCELGKDMPLYRYCSDFEMLRDKRSYVEVDTDCDVCEYSDRCKLISVTNLYDKREHYIDTEWNECVYEQEWDDEEGDEDED